MNCVSLFKVENKEDLSTCHSIRKEVFVKGQNIPREIELDNKDDACIHFIFKVHGVSIGTSRLYPESEDVIQLQRVAILREFRNKGYGRLLVQEIEKYIMDNTNYKEISISSQDDVKYFYKELGYELTNKTYVEANIPHVYMKKKLIN